MLQSSIRSARGAGVDRHHPHSDPPGLTLQMDLEDEQTPLEDRVPGDPDHPAARGQYGSAVTF